MYFVFRLRINLQYDKFKRMRDRALAVCKDQQITYSSVVIL